MPEFREKTRAKNPNCSEILTVVSSLKSTASDPQSRGSPRHFSRDGPLTPELLTTLLLYMVADGNRRGYALRAKVDMKPS